MLDRDVQSALKVWRNYTFQGLSRPVEMRPDYIISINISIGMIN